MSDGVIDPPVVSVVMSVFNGENHLSKAIESILNQTFRNFEFIIINDGSVDGARKLLDEYASQDRRIRLVHHECSAGLPVRLNEAIRISHGQYVARMDGDDIAFPARLMMQVDFMKHQPGIDLLASSVLFIDENDDIVGVLPCPTEHKDLISRPWKSIPMPHPTWMGRREWFIANQYDEYMRKAQDQEILYRTYRDSNFAAINQPLLAYRNSHISVRKMLYTRYHILYLLWTNGRFTDAFKATLLQGVAAIRDLSSAIFCFDHIIISRKAQPVDEELRHCWVQLRVQLHNSVSKKLQ